MRETKAKKTASRPSLSIVFVHSHDERKRLSTFQQPLPWWSRLRSWIEYYSTQWRWDIERRLARLFHQRWGG
jgi:hypothetical protein